jgi:hypothetical protein
MKKIVLLIVLLPAVIFSQETKSTESPVKSQIIPIQAQYSDEFCIKNVNFNKFVDIYGRGEVLEVEFEIVNKTDDPLDMYLIVIATFEKKERTRSSFERPIPEKERVRTFVPFPLNLDNFQYPVVDSKGNQAKDKEGKALTRYVKFPRDPKQGVNPLTGGMYHVEKKLVVRTTHLSKYRTNYYYFNEVAILAFNKNGEPQYKQSYRLVGFRR